MSENSLNTADQFAGAVVSAGYNLDQDGIMAYMMDEMGYTLDSFKEGGQGFEILQMLHREGALKEIKAQDDNDEAMMHVDELANELIQSNISNGVLDYYAVHASVMESLVDTYGYKIARLMSKPVHVKLERAGLREDMSDPNSIQRLAHFTVIHFADKKSYDQGVDAITKGEIKEEDAITYSIPNDNSIIISPEITDEIAAVLKAHNVVNYNIQKISSVKAPKREIFSDRDAKYVVCSMREEGFTEEAIRHMGWSDFNALFHEKYASMDMDADVFYDIVKPKVTAALRLADIESDADNEKEEVIDNITYDIAKCASDGIDQYPNDIDLAFMYANNALAKLHGDMVATSLTEDLRKAVNYERAKRDVMAQGLMDKSPTEPRGGIQADTNKKTAGIGDEMPELYSPSEEEEDEEIVVYDNGGKTADRYTVIIGDDFFAMGDTPKDPGGFNQFLGGRADGYKEGPHLGKRVKFESLPKQVQEAILERKGSKKTATGRKCYYLTESGKIAEVRENEPGYYETDYTVGNQTRDVLEDMVKKMNDRLGLSSKDVHEIMMSSMFPNRKRESKAIRHKQGAGDGIPPNESPDFPGDKNFDMYRVRGLPNRSPDLGGGYGNMLRKRRRLMRTKYCPEMDVTSALSRYKVDISGVKEYPILSVEGEIVVDGKKYPFTWEAKDEALNFKSGKPGFTEDNEEKVLDKVYDSALRWLDKQRMNIAILKKPHTPEEIAKKHGVSVEEVDKALQVGQKIEMEHTDDPEEAASIASHHLWEHADYYDEKIGLPAMERSLESEGSKKTAAFDTWFQKNKDNLKRLFDTARNPMGLDFDSWAKERYQKFYSMASKRIATPPEFCPNPNCRGDMVICQKCGRDLCFAEHKFEWRPDITGNEHAANVCEDCVKKFDQAKKSSITVKRISAGEMVIEVEGKEVSVPMLSGYKVGDSVEVMSRKAAIEQLKASDRAEDAEQLENRVFDRFEFVTKDWVEDNID